MEQRAIMITEPDLERLQALLAQQRATSGSSAHLAKLQAELDKALVVKPKEVPGDVVTMRSTVELADLDTGETEVHTLVFPEEADIAQGKLSVLAPIGTAMLGYRVGDEFEWEVPAGVRRLRVSKVLYQPEAAGDWEHLRTLLVMYGSAIREIQTKLEILNDDFRVKQHHSPIASIKSRVKEPESIARKLASRGLEVSWDSIVQNLNDVAGIRVVCPFIDDIYFVADTLLAQDDITLIEREDYIAEPKANGYRSLHLVVEVPVFLPDKKQPVRVEVQIRTIAMDFWASLEHEIRYGRDIPESDAIALGLRDCAETISQTDIRMQEIHRRLQ